jgi:signal transduction histidine kinase
VKNNANRLMDLINDILEIGRIDSEKIQLNFEEVDIRDVVDEVLQTLQVQIDRKAMTVAVEIGDSVPMVVADTRRLSQVVLNLASNALKYTFPNGQITLRSFLNPAGMLQVDVQDNGVGISAEDQKSLFRRFQRFDNPLRDEAGGTGLGLSIAKSLVELHGGEMWVESEPGEGSTFSFILPITQSEQNDDPGAQVAA